MKLRNLRRHAYLLATFRNGPALVRNLRNGGKLADGPPMSEAVPWRGGTIHHPANRSGLSGSLVEIWHDNLYGLGSFYRPSPGDTVLDIGAHIGLFALALARREPRCRVIAVEASPENYACLESNLRGYPQVEARHVAIGARPGWVCSTLETNRSIDARVRQTTSDDPEATEVTTLPQLLSEVGRVALLKMDVEGAERGVFDSVEGRDLRRIDRIALEYHDNYEPGTLAGLRERLESTHGLRIAPDGATGHGLLFARRRG